MLFEDGASYVQDREDLIAILKMRFGEIPPKVIEEIYAIEEYDTLERLIVVSSNVPSLKIFLEELKEGAGSFKILGERFNPLQSFNEEGENR